MVTHSSILAWRIPWTEEPGRLQSMGSHKSTKERDDDDAMLVLSLGRVEPGGGVTTETSFGLLSQTLLTTALCKGLEVGNHGFQPHYSLSLDN